MAKKKQATKLPKKPLSARFGSFVARTVPGSAVKLGRLSKKAGTGVANASKNFKDGFLEGWDEV